jgi:hypothetical protein
MKYRWRDGKAQAIAYLPTLGRCAVVKEADSIHELYDSNKDEDEDDNGDNDEDEEDDGDDEEDSDKDDEY